MVTERERDQLLQDLENERKRRAELSAALLMAREAKTLEADAAARKAAAEKEKELQEK